MPIVTWRDPDSGRPLTRSVAIALPLVAGALCFGMGSTILKVLGLAVWAKLKKGSSDRAEQMMSSFASPDPEIQEIIASYRERFREGPVGMWRSSLDQRIGLGFDSTGLYGNTIEFRPDGSGTLASWSWRGEEQTVFHWKSCGPCEVAISGGVMGVETGAEDEPSIVKFDFFVIGAGRQVFLHQSDHVDKFWWAVGPLIQLEESR